MAQCLTYSRGVHFVSLIELAAKDPDKFAGYTIEQIVAICGDGKIRDNSDASSEFKTFLGLQTSTKLAEHANYCLEQGFERSGFVLQDVVNEIGRRLGYKVTNGIYQGKRNAIGFDGIWDDGTSELIVEIKTTDAYRINLDTLFKYGEKINGDARFFGKDRQCLIVVGRQDTGDLEAQVRGSRYAWSVRLISVDAVIRLMFVNEEVDDISLVKKIRQILLPIEYTRVDNIVDLVFEAQQTQEEKVSVIPPDVSSSEEEDAKQAYDFTPRAELDAKRMAIVASFFKSRAETFDRKTKTAFSSSSRDTHVVCAVSKRYARASQPYWYALHPHWLEFIKEAKQGFLLLGGMDSKGFYALPVDKLMPLLPKLNQTTREKEGRTYWHLAIGEAQGAQYFNLSKVSEKFNLASFRFTCE